MLDSPAVVTPLPKPLAGCFVGLAIGIPVAFALCIAREVIRGEEDIGEILQWGMLGGLFLGSFAGAIVGAAAGFAVDYWTSRPRPGAMRSENR